MSEEGFPQTVQDMPLSPVWKDSNLLCVSTSSDGGWSEGGFDRLSPRSSDRLSFLHSSVRQPIAHATHTSFTQASLPPSSITSPQLKRIGQLAAALVAELCYQDGQSSEAPLQSPTTMDELEQVMEHALLQSSALSQQHQTVATQLAHSKLQLATLQGTSTVTA